MHIDPEMFTGVRQATQSNRVFGADHFQIQIEAKLALRIAKPGPRRRETSSVQHIGRQAVADTIWSGIASRKHAKSRA